MAGCCIVYQIPSNLDSPKFYFAPSANQPNNNKSQEIYTAVVNFDNDNQVYYDEKFKDSKKCFRKDDLGDDINHLNEFEQIKLIYGYLCCYAGQLKMKKNKYACYCVENGESVKSVEENTLNIVIKELKEGENVYTDVLENDDKGNDGSIQIKPPFLADIQAQKKPSFFADIKALRKGGTLPNTTYSKKIQLSKNHDKCIELCNDTIWKENIAREECDNSNKGNINSYTNLTITGLKEYINRVTVFLENKIKKQGMASTMIREWALENRENIDIEKRIRECKDQWMKDIKPSNSKKDEDYSWVYDIKGGIFTESNIFYSIWKTIYNKSLDKKNAIAELKEIINNIIASFARSEYFDIKKTISCWNTLKDNLPLTDKQSIIELIDKLTELQNEREQIAIKKDIMNKKLTNLEKKHLKLKETIETLNKQITRFEISINKQKKATAKHHLTKSISDLNELEKQRNNVQLLIETNNTAIYLEEKKQTSILEKFKDIVLKQHEMRSKLSNMLPNNYIFTFGEFILKKIIERNFSNEKTPLVTIIQHEFIDKSNSDSIFPEDQVFNKFVYSPESESTVLTYKKFLKLLNTTHQINETNNIEEPEYKCKKAQVNTNVSSRASKTKKSIHNQLVQTREEQEQAQIQLQPPKVHSTVSFNNTLPRISLMGEIRKKKVNTLVKKQKSPTNISKLEELKTKARELGLQYNHNNTSNTLTQKIKKYYLDKAKLLNINTGNIVNNINDTKSYILEQLKIKIRSMIPSFILNENDSIMQLERTFNFIVTIKQFNIDINIDNIDSINLQRQIYEIYKQKYNMLKMLIIRNKMENKITIKSDSFEPTIPPNLLNTSLILLIQEYNEISPKLTLIEQINEKLIILLSELNNTLPNEFNSKEKRNPILYKLLINELKDIFEKNNKIFITYIVKKLNGALNIGDGWKPSPGSTQPNKKPVTKKPGTN